MSTLTILANGGRDGQEPRLVARRATIARKTGFVIASDKPERGYGHRITRRDSMAQTFTTEFLPASRRFEAWKWTVRQVCGDCRVLFPKQIPFSGSIELQSVGGLSFMRFASSPISFVETLSDVSETQAGYLLITQVEGARSYSQNGSVALLKPGDSTLIDSGHVWSSQCGERSVRLYLRVPRKILENYLQSAHPPVAQRIAGQNGIGATLCRLAASVYEEAREYEEREGAAALHAYLELFAACLKDREGEEEEDRKGRLSSRIKSYVEAHLVEPGLNPTGIAEAIGISLRHLHRVFGHKGITLGNWIRKRRLEQCRQELLSSRARRRSITEIAYSWGFSDSAHFSRSFRREFGIAPRELRRQQRPEGWPCRERDERADSWGENPRPYRASKLN